jgi:DNA-binding response OmpR family regulator
MSPLGAPPVVRPEPGEPLSETPTARAGRTAEPVTGPSPNGLHVNRPSRRVWVDAREIALTFQEFELLAHFIAHPWTVFTRAELMQALWPAMDPATRTVDVHVHRLRRKLGRLSAQLTTVRRVGYVYRPHLTNRGTPPSTEK